MEKKVSVIIPVYNTEKYLSECITSVLNQSYKNYEIILVDDGSTDKSPIICDKFGKNFSCIKVIHKENEGAGIARNYGVSVAKGEFVTFVDSDDYIGPKMLESLITDQEKYNADLCIGGTFSVNQNKKVVHIEKYNSIQSYEDDSIIKKLLPRIFGSSPKKHDSIKIGNCNNLFKTCIIKKNNLKFESERKVLSEDLIWLINYLLCTQKVIVVPEMEYYVRINQASMTHKYNPERFNLTIAQFKRMRNYIGQLKLSHDVNYRLEKQFFINIRWCIKQESHLKINKSYIHIKNFLSNKTLLFAISDYPISQLGYKPRIFLELLKKRRAVILCILAKLKII